MAKAPAPGKVNRNGGAGKKAAARKGGAASRPENHRGGAPVAEPSPRRGLAQEVAALLLLGVALFLLLSLLSRTVNDPQSFRGIWQTGGVRNWGGKTGALLSLYLWGALGFASLWLPVLLAGMAWRVHRLGLESPSGFQIAAAVGAPAASAGLLSLARPFVPWENTLIHTGGWVGDGLSIGLTALLNGPGAALGLALALVVSLMGLTRLSLVGLLGLMGQLLRRLRERPAAGPPPEPIEASKPARSTTSPLIKRTGPDPEEAPLPPPVRQAPPKDSGARPRRPASGSAFTLPPLDLLDPPQPWDQTVQEEAMVAQARKLEDTLRHFGVEGKVTAIVPGPVVSRFELEPAPGVKISKVTGLADDLALALKALSIRIVAPVPGKAVIGIEVPNPKRQVVALREILSDQSYQRSASRLTLALGKDIMGAPVVTDLGRMPHLLIAGATGSGKSVGLNTMILSVLYKATPEEVRFLLIDPKRIELSTYEGIPHLLHPVVVNPKEATAALHWAVMEMERRYALLSELGVRNVESYNQKAKSRAAKTVPDQEDLPRSLPYIIIVIDELADLMLVSSRDTEEYLIRLAQKARASGLHLLVATQRPSVDVITGLIKANFPTRISFQVSSKADARVILDSVGSERLLGMGDMLFIPPGTSRQRRIHGAFVSEEEVERVVEFLKTQAAPEYEPGITEMAEKEKDEEESGDKDEKWDEALALVAETRNASISMLQRRLRIGYNRAARIIETMEREGLVGPSDGLKPREVYIPRR